MRDDEGPAFFWGFVIGLFLASVFWWSVFENTTHSDAEIIKHGAAYYHPETGAFTWKDSDGATEIEVQP